MNLTIVKKLAEEFEEQFICLRKNPEKYITFTVSIEKEVTRIDKNRNEIIKTSSSRLKFIDGVRFMTNSLSDLINILANEVQKLGKR